MKPRAPLRQVCIVVLTAVLVCFSIMGCAPKANTKGVPTADTSEAIEIAWSMQIDCKTCHTKEAKSLTESGKGACIHEEQAQTTCVSCHTDEATLSEVHAGKTATDTMPQVLKKTKVSVEACQNAECHALSVEEMNALTVNYADMVDLNGTWVNPHEVIAMTESHASMTCADCHVMHGSPIAAETSCVSCHHSGVYECNTCH